MAASTAATYAASPFSERIIESTLVDPPRSNLATWYALLAEIQLTTGNAAGAMASLRKAETFRSTYGERYAEGLLLLMRARTGQARGDATASVRAAAREALDLSASRGAHLFAMRSEQLLAHL